MAGFSVMSTITVDFDKVQKAVETLTANPPTKEEVAGDPKAFLAKYGVEIDDDMHNLIKSQLSGSEKGAVQAAIVHIDAG
jgi:hypothetical protein